MAPPTPQRIKDKQLMLFDMLESQDEQDFQTVNNNRSSQNMTVTKNTPVGSNFTTLLKNKRHSIGGRPARAMSAIGGKKPIRVRQTR